MEENSRVLLKENQSGVELVEFRKFGCVLLLVCFRADQLIMISKCSQPTSHVNLAPNDLEFVGAGLSALALFMLDWSSMATTQGSPFRLGFSSMDCSATAMTLGKPFQCT